MLAEATRSLYVSQPWLLDAVPTSSAPGPNTLRWFEHCLQAMAALDRTTAAEDGSRGVLNGVIMLFARSAAAPTAIDFGAIDPARHPLLTAALTGSVPGRPTADLFERAVRALLGGLLDERAG